MNAAAPQSQYKPHSIWIVKFFFFHCHWTHRVLIFISLFFVIRPECMGVRIYVKRGVYINSNCMMTALNSLLDRMEKYFLFQSIYSYSAQFTSAQRRTISLRTYDRFYQMFVSWWHLQKKLILFILNLS